METRDLTTIVIIGAFAGLIFFATSYGLMVWLMRQRRARTLEPEDERPSAIVTVLIWASVTLGAASFARSIAARSVHVGEGLLVGEDLFVVRPRAALVATYAASGPSVRAGEVLVSFRGRDGEDARPALERRKRILEEELALERARPVETDPEVVRELQAAELEERQLEQRARDLVAGRDAVGREATDRDLGLRSRLSQVGQDILAAEHDEAQARASLEPARESLRADLTLLERGLASRLDVDARRVAVALVESRLEHARGRRAVLEVERAEIARLAEASASTHVREVEARARDLEGVRGRLPEAAARLEAARRALGRDRTRALDRRENRLRQVEIQLEECEELLAGAGSHAVARAPFDGRIGFREPSPASPPSADAPLLVLHQPGHVLARVRVPGGEAQADPDLEVALEAPSVDAGRRPFPGHIASHSPQPDGTVELRIGCEPPDRVLRELVVRGAVPVRIDVRRPLFGTAAFRAGAAFAALAVVLAAGRAARRRPRPAGRPERRSGGPVELALPMQAACGFVVRPAPGEGTLALLGHDGAELRTGPPPWRIDLAPGDGDGDDDDGRHRAASPASSPSPSGAGLPAVISPAHVASRLHALGVELRREVEASAVAPAILEVLDCAIARGGTVATDMVILGFGDAIHERPVAEAAFALLVHGAEPPPDGRGLDPAIDDCARYLRILRAIGSARLNGSLDRLEWRLATLACAVAEGQGLSVSSEHALFARLRCRDRVT